MSVRNEISSQLVKKIIEKLKQMDEFYAPQLMAALTEIAEPFCKQHPEHKQFIEGICAAMAHLVGEACKDE